MIVLYLSCVFVIKITAAVNIVKSPDENVWVEQGKNVSLVCATDQQWQWCYWEHYDFTLKNKTIYQTVQEYTALDTPDPQIKFANMSNTTCGIQMLNVSQQQHQVRFVQSTLHVVDDWILKYYIFISGIGRQNYINFIHHREVGNAMWLKQILLPIQHMPKM